jgi:hypothetical protein
MTHGEFEKGVSLYGGRVFGVVHPVGLCCVVCGAWCFGIVEVWYLDLEILDLRSVVRNLGGRSCGGFPTGDIWTSLLKLASLIAWSSLVWQSRTLGGLKGSSGRSPRRCGLGNPAEKTSIFTIALEA